MEEFKQIFYVVGIILLMIVAVRIMKKVEDPPEDTSFKPSHQEGESEEEKED
jgi:hypothetical protein